MSGFVGILSTAGRPVAAAALEPLVRSIEYRGPHGTGVRALGTIGFGHTLLRTGPAHPRERQPATLDGDVWMVGDVRVDGRAELAAALHARGRIVPGDATDAELVLHAYAAWGEDCPRHLLGDFAFAIWDGPKRTLFCARDPMGVKPFFHARLREAFVFGNTLNCLRLHPDVPDDLDDLAIADFLMFGYGLDVASSAFAAIRRLPPAHALSVVGDRFRTWRYWTLPVEEPLYFKRAADYVDRFRELLSTAVRDRLRSDRVAVFMSGGLDSTLLAAEAKAQSTGAEAVTAFTYVYDHLIDDAERHHAGETARHLGIPIRFWVQDAEPNPRPPLSLAPLVPPEPIAEPETYAREVERYREMAGCARVAFYGEGPDNALRYEWRPYLAYLWRAGRWARLVSDIGSHLVAHRRVPLLPTIPGMLRARRERREWEVPFPAWLNPDLVRRLDLRRRWDEEMHSPSRGDAVHPVRPNGYRSMHLPLWPWLFECLDAGSTRAPLDVRHPYVDLRLLRFLLAVPAMPWCREKLLLRRAAGGLLPKATVRRAKSPLRGDPGFARSRGRVPSPSPIQMPLLGPFIAPGSMPSHAAPTPSIFRENSRPSELGFWLQGVCS